MSYFRYDEISYYIFILRGIDGAETSCCKDR